MSKKIDSKTQQPQFSVVLSDTLKMFEDAKRDHAWNHEEVYRLDQLTQDWLHELELGNLTYAERAKIATKLATTRKNRRASKDTYELLTPLIDYLESERGKQMLDRLRETLGQTRKIEERMKTRTYRYRVLEHTKTTNDES